MALVATTLAQFINESKNVNEFKRGENPYTALDLGFKEISDFFKLKTITPENLEAFGKELLRMRNKRRAVMQLKNLTEKYPEVNDFVEASPAINNFFKSLPGDIMSDDDELWDFLAKKSSKAEGWEPFDNRWARRPEDRPYNQGVVDRREYYRNNPGRIPHKKKNKRSMFEFTRQKSNKFK